MRSPLALALVVLLALACARTEDPEVKHAREASEIGRQLMSPFCPGRTLAECSSPDAGAIREQIRAELRAGETPEAVRARLEARWGEQVASGPRSWLGALLPVIGIIAGGGVLWLTLRRVVARPGDRPAALPPKLEAELARELDDIER
jgi:cytochrome c-type biogenesis protein CcmH